MPISAVLYQLYNGLIQKKLIMQKNYDNENLLNGNGRKSYNDEMYEDNDRRNRESILSFLEDHENDDS